MGYVRRRKDLESFSARVEPGENLRSPSQLVDSQELRWGFEMALGVAPTLFARVRIAIHRPRAKGN